MIEFECPHCGNVLRVEPAHAGRHAWCRRCKRVAIVPSLKEGVESASETHDRETVLAVFPPMSSLAGEQEGPASGAVTTLSPPLPSLQEVDELHSQLDLQTSKLSDLATELEAVRSQREALRDELKRAREELELAARQAAEALDERQRSEAAIQSTLALEQNGQLAALAEAQEEARQARQETDRHRQVLEDSRERVRALEEHVRLLERERESAQQVRSERDSLQERLAEVERLLSARDASLADLQTRCDRSAEDAARAEAALEALRQREASHMSEMEQIQRRLIETENAVEASRNAAETASTLATTRESELLDLGRELETLRAAHAALESSAAESGPELANLRARIAQTDEEIRGLERDAEEALVLARDREQETAQLRADLSAARTAAEEASQEAARLREALEEANATLENLRAESMEREVERQRAALQEGDEDASLPDIESSDTLPAEVVAHKVDEDQTMLVDALLRFLGRK
ncbi:MAG: hypothetical protein IT365_12270 [Candidatus Hydrogenedentes bacterium]|nr:hypothetical protein [Candidatus Hydrogenedentota bacterium]